MRHGPSLRPSLRIAVLLAVLVAGCGKNPVDGPDSPVTTAMTPGPDRLMVSGHSLTGPPLPEQLAAIAASQGRPLQWQMQDIGGSTIATRSRGSGSASASDTASGRPWSGFSTGRNRDGQNLDIAAELKAPATVSGGPYDALLITEQHNILGSIVWDDSVRHLRQFHERLIAGNRAGTTWLYQSWRDIDDKDDPSRWIAYETSAATAWQCIAVRINTSLAAEGRRDRITLLPVGQALALLVEKSNAEGGIPALGGGGPRATIERLFRDDVHLTPMGSYFVALFTYARLYGHQPADPWAPPGLDERQARALQHAAWQISEELRAAETAIDLPGCRHFLSTRFTGLYLDYELPFMTRDKGRVRAYGRALKLGSEWRRLFASDDVSNPFRYDPLTDRGWWFPAPASGSSGASGSS